MTDALTYVVVRLQNAYVGLQTAYEDARDREDGQALVEYALILSLIALVVIGALTLLGGKIKALFSDIGSAL